MGAGEKKHFQKNIIAGLPGSEESFTLEQFQAALDTYQISIQKNCVCNLVEFLKAVIPVAEENGVKLAIHPDDPPYPLLGLPRIVSTAGDVDALIRRNSFRSQRALFLYRFLWCAGG